MPDALRQRLGEILEIESSNFNNHPTLLIDPSCHRIFPTFTNLKNYKRSPSQKKKRFAKISLRFEKSFQNRLEIYCARGEKSYTCDVNESRHENAAIITQTQSHPHHSRASTRIIERRRSFPPRSCLFYYIKKRGLDSRTTLSTIYYIPPR